MTNEDRQFMRRAIDLAKAGEGWAHPNPLVGAVIVKDGRIIGEGYHRKCGELHAERNAIADAKNRAGGSAADALEGAAIYVTLEPCCPYGKTPPCTEAIIENKIARVVIGSRDPNPLVAGKGAKILREAGIEVLEDFLQEECDALNPVFFHYIGTKTPYVIMKYAMILHGLPFAILAAFTARNSKMPEFLTTATNIIIPISTPMVLKSMNPSASTGSSIPISTSSIAPISAQAALCSFSDTMTPITATKIASAIICDAVI